MGGGTGLIIKRSHELLRASTLFNLFNMLRAFLHRSMRALLLFVVVLLLPRDGVCEDDALAPSDRFRIAKGVKPITLPVRIDGRIYRFLMDTGSSISSFDRSLSNLLGSASGKLPVYTANEDIPREIERFYAPPMSLGRQSLDDVSEVVCIDYRSRGIAFDGRVFDGWLGMDACRSLIVRIDFDAGEVSLLQSVPEGIGQPVPLVWFRGAPAVRVSLDNADVKFPSAARFIVDTGDLGPHSGNLYGPVFRTLVYYGLAAEGGRSPRITIVNTAHARTARLSNFRLQDFPHRGLTFSEASINSLSLRYLSRYIVTFDFPRMRMFLKPGARYSESDNAYTADLDLRRRQGQKRGQEKRAKGES